MLCGLPRPLMSDQNAASWGYFNTQSQSWNSDILQMAGFPTHLLPDIAEPGSLAGRTSHTWFEIPAGTEYPRLGGTCDFWGETMLSLCKSHFIRNIIVVTPLMNLPPTAGYLNKFHFFSRV
ncbi:carbohydrate kinase-like, isoform CRA_c, partial [Rattus norvegicus]